MISLKDRIGKSKGKLYWTLLTENVSCFLWQQIYLLNPFDKEAAKQAKLAFQKQLKIACKKGALPPGRAKQQRTAAPMEAQDDDDDAAPVDDDAAPKNAAAVNEEDEDGMDEDEDEGDEDPEEGASAAV
jgi:hypothetical protein